MNWLCPCLARRHKADHERDPLLPRAKNTSRLSNDDDDPERRLDNHLLAALAALRAHKLPDTHQLLRILDTCGSTSGRGVKGDVGRAAGALGRVLGEENVLLLLSRLSVRLRMPPSMRRRSTTVPALWFCAPTTLHPPAPVRRLYARVHSGDGSFLLC
ncbi:hypothetical protein PLICRDRAFT_181698 [Plicaturopsis crispa FD-325 SS-3]|nr:hypothetical protein PLICRDRAFT_181698 [Plicaturopsis crispa FD-325 SS-3]